MNERENRKCGPNYDSRIKRKELLLSPKGRPIVIDGQENIRSEAFLVDGKHLVGGGNEGKIRRWRVEDGEEVGMPIDAGSPVVSIAVSRDGKWIVSGTESGLVTVWNVETHEKLTELREYKNRVKAVDVSPARDGTRIATGSDDKTVCVWSLSTGERLLGPLKHDDWVVATKFSPDGRFIATATWAHDSVRVYHSHNGHLFVDAPIRAYSALNRWILANDAKQLFVLSHDGNINRLDAYTGAILWKRPIHSSSNAKCITLASNGMFIAASAGSSISFWDTATHKQIGSVIDQVPTVDSIAISSNHDLATTGGNTISLFNLHDILPWSYFDNVSAFLMRQVPF